MILSSRTARTLASVAAVALLVSGCGDDADEGDQTNTTQGTPSPTLEPPNADEPDEGSAAPDASQGVNATDAIDRALEAVQGDVLSLDREDDNSRWEVLVRTADGNGTEVWVDATSGDVLDQRSEEVPSEARDGAPSFTAKEAVEAAETAVGSGSVTDLDIDRERGTVIWEVTVEDNGNETDVKIDASSGEVLSQEQDN